MSTNANRNPLRLSPTVFLGLLVFGLLSILSNTSIPNPDLVAWTGLRDPKVLVLTAHPDDECMFFAPAIIAMRAENISVSALCLSTGNATGLGATRRSELFASYAVLGVPSEQIVALDNPALQDGMNEYWDPKDIAVALKSYLELHPIDLIVTFDTGGITQHPNHCPLSHALESFPTGRPRLLTLKTVPKYIKFTGPVFVLSLKLRHLLTTITSPLFSTPSYIKNPGVVFTSDVKGYKTALQAMQQHESQLVWFRWLYVAASKYMWSVTLVEVV